MKIYFLIVVSIALGGCATTKGSPYWPYGKQESANPPADEFFKPYDGFIRNYGLPPVQVNSTPGRVVTATQPGPQAQAGAGSAEPKLGPVEATGMSERPRPSISTKRTKRQKPVEITGPAPKSRSASKDEDAPVSIDLRKEPR